MGQFFIYAKALHIIFVVAWFAALFYFPRLLIYHREALDKDASERDILISQFQIMEKRLLNIIMWPAAIITLCLGVTLLYNHVLGYGSIQSWMMWKLGFLVFLYGYHHSLHSIYKKFKKGNYKYTSNQLRFINEVATILLFAIVFLVVLKNALNALYGVVGLFALVAILTVAIKLYKNSREK